MNVFIAFALLALIFLQSLNATSVSINLLRTTPNPVEVIGGVILNPEVKLGEDLIVKRMFRRKVYCKVDVDRFIVKLPEKTVMRRERLPAGTTSIGEDTIYIHIPIKLPILAGSAFGRVMINEADLVPGSEYILREFLHSDCGDRLHTVKFPDLTFKVVG